MITADRLRVLLDYDPETGLFRWNVQKGPAVPGKITGVANNRGQLQIGIDGGTYQAHRLAYLFMTGEWPPVHMDHVNGDRSDNRWCNLRPATPSQNHANRRKTDANSTGFKGVSRKKGSDSYQAFIKVRQRTIYLGTFDKAEDAHDVYLLAANKHFGEFARAK